MSSKIITPETPLLIPPLLAAEIGWKEATILQQIHYFCGISKHIKDDGKKWFWKTLESWRETLPFLSLSSIRRAIANLKDKFGLIEVKKHSKETWYQANWFTINFEALESLWLSICSNQQMHMSNLDTSTCSSRANHIKDYSSENLSSNIFFNKEAEKMKVEEMEIKIEDYTPKPAIPIEKVADKDNSTTPVKEKRTVEQPKKSNVEVIVPPRAVDPFFGQSRKPSDVIWDWIPDGPWKVDGKLDNAFIDWHAKRWLQKGWGLDIHEARKNVRASYRNEPVRLANDWQEYQESTAVKLANMALREQNEVKVSEEEKAELYRHQGAFKSNPQAPTAPNTGEVQRYKEWLEQTKPQEIIAPAPQQEPRRLEAEREIDWEAIAFQNQQWEKEQMDLVPEGADNPQAYLNKPKQEDIDFYKNLYEERERQKKQSPISSSQPTEFSSHVQVSQAIARYTKESHAIQKLTAQEMQKLREEERQQRNVAHWNNLLDTGIPSCMHEARLQAEKAGYQVVNNRVVKGE
ncbi:hypothetical protein NIES4101_53380 [Calothrix sp. NIES-4101]|nr:hypothetical protein NIES4101_53380 [Calothrix sp. NIES-4101]